MDEERWRVRKRGQRGGDEKKERRWEEGDGGG